MIDKIWTTTTGLSGVTENTKDANLGEVIVRSGLNFVRGTDYAFSDTTNYLGSSPDCPTNQWGGHDQRRGQSLLDHARVPLSLRRVRSRHVQVQSQLWLRALVVDDIFQPSLSVGDVGDAVVNVLIPQDTLDFSALAQESLFHDHRSDVGRHSADSRYLPRKMALRSI